MYYIKYYDDYGNLHIMITEDAGVVHYLEKTYGIENKSNF